jgi:hypothetical protein
MVVAPQRVRDSGTLPALLILELLSQKGRTMGEHMEEKRDELLALIRS